MNLLKLRSVRGLGGLLAGLGALVTTLVVTSTAAMAMLLPPDGGGEVSQPVPLPVAAGGMPGWEITFIAAGAALVAAVLAVLADRARPARRRPALAPAGDVQAQSSVVR